MSIESTFLDASSYIDVETVQFKEGVDLNLKTLRSRKGGSVPQECARRLKELLPSAAVNVLQHCLKKVRMYIRDSHQSKHEELAETSVASCGTTTERMNNAE